MGAAVVSLLFALLLTSIFERRGEAQNPFFRVVAIDDDTVDPAAWGRSFPLQYDLYDNTVDMIRTRHGGSEAIPMQPTEVDPREEITASRLVEDSRLRTMWAGYAFAEDFREERGPASMFIDQIFTRRRSVVQQPAHVFTATPPPTPSTATQATAI